MTANSAIGYADGVMDKQPDERSDGKANIDAVVRDCHGDMMRMLRARLRSAEDAADIAQEAYTRLLRYSDDEPEALRRLLFRIADNLVTDHWRHKQAHPEHDAEEIDESALTVVTESTQERFVEQSERVVMFKEVVLALPPKCRRVFLLSRIQGRSNYEIAEICGITVKMVEKHITKALAECRARVGESALTSLYPQS